MSNKLHLTYGIVIGILFFACAGSKINEQKQFKETYLVTWLHHMSDTTGDGFVSRAGNEDGERRVIIPTSSNTPNEILKAGWTIIDMEIYQSPTFQNSSYLTSYYLIGR